MGVVGVDQAVGIKSMNEKEFVLPYNSIFVLCDNYYQQQDCCVNFRGASNIVLCKDGILIIWDCLFVFVIVSILEFFKTRFLLILDNSFGV